MLLEIYVHGLCVFQYEPLTEPWYDLVYGMKHEGAVGETLEGDFVSMQCCKVT